MNDDSTPAVVAKPENRALVTASLRILAGRDMSRAEFVRKLAGKDFTALEAEQAADWCIAEGWLNEARYAENASRRLSARYGASRVAQKLRQKGVTAEQVDSGMAALKETEAARAREVWERKFVQAPADGAEKAKQSRYLQSRGFSFDAIRQLFKDLATAA